MKKSPGTSGLMPVKGSGCGIRPNIEEMEDSEGFDFSAASELLQKNESDDQASEENSDHRLQTKMETKKKLAKNLKEEPKE
ncbi:hypothetical protein [Thalassolituus sp. UBA3500]|mgnify:CR=1 FL=1|uniref:hypothetical protein n=1 Tax=Thalassolituus sp. UBA3500 TaxID=1947664 RepID=UPI00263AB415|nr:hypothetical protein [Thalassolituus sp. UBA3500]|tara:strand:- start:3617 stop:3859 length:243 start_codon:yes stop_codon:yes gene_type:complete